MKKLITLVMILFSFHAAAAKTVTALTPGVWVKLANSGDVIEMLQPYGGKIWCDSVATQPAYDATDAFMFENEQLVVNWTLVEHLWCQARTAGVSLRVNTR